MKVERPLEGVRVLDLGVFGAGPIGSTFLGDLGADVIKVEHPDGGDTLRHIPPLYRETSLFWVVEGRNKKSITLNLSKPRGQAVARDLVKFSDIVLENFRPGTLERWNLGYEELKKIKEDIILVRVSGYGQDGPYSSRASFDYTGQAMGGLTYVTGTPDGPPTRAGLAICDYVTALFNAFSAVVALYYRDGNKKAKGQWIDVAQYEAIFRMMDYSVAVYDKLGIVRERAGNRHPGVSPGDNFMTADKKWITIVVGNDKIFGRLARAMGREDLIDDPRFKTIHQRVENTDAIHDIVREWVTRYSAKEVIDIMDDAQVPANLVNSIEDIFNDPHYKARNSIIEVDDPVVGKVKMQGVIPRFSLTPGGVDKPAARLGENNVEVYKGLLKYSQEKLDSLKEEGVI